MPNYVYKCISCDTTVTIFHSFSEKATDCDSCGALNSLKRDYTASFNTLAGGIKINKEVGQVVRQHIEEAREEIKQEKEKFEREVFDD